MTETEQTEFSRLELQLQEHTVNNNESKEKQILCAHYSLMII